MTDIRSTTGRAEQERLQALADLEILDTDPDDAFDSIAMLAAKIIGAPIALVSLVDEHRQWFKARVGLEVTETDRASSFCAQAIDAGPEVFVVADATADPRFASNPLVLDDPNIRAYAGAPMRHPDGHLLGTVCVIDQEPRAFTDADLTLLASLADQAVLEMRLRKAGIVNRDLVTIAEQTEQRHRLVFDQAPIGMATVEPDGRFSSVNPALCRLLGRTPDQLTARTFQDITHPDDLDADEDRVERITAGLIDGYELPKRYLLPDGTPVPVLLQVQAARAADGTVEFFVAQIQDRTEAARVDAERRARLADLHRTQVALEDAVEVKDHVLAMATHDMRNPLSVILGHAALLTDHADDLSDADARTSLEAIRQHGHRLDRLVDDLLSLSTIDSGKLALDLEDLDLRAEIDAIIGHRDTGIDDEVEVEIDIAPGCVVHADPQRLGQIITNLVANARRYGEPPIVITASTIATWVDLRVTDHGSGVPTEFVPHLFDKFSRAREAVSRATRGTGLGLAIVRALTHAHGGDVWYETTPTDGATFVIRLPTSAAHTDPTDTARETEAPEPTILLAAAEPTLIEALGRTRTEVLVHGDDLREIIPAVLRSRPTVLVIEQGEEPDLAIREVLELLRSNPVTADTPVLVAHHDADAPVAATLEAGASDAVTLPIPAVELQARIDVLVKTSTRTSRLKVENTELDHASHTDPLTGLANRRSLRSDLTRLSSYARRHQEPMAVLLIDVDHFKAVNDGYGHSAGDRVLARLARSLLEHRRTEDVVGRWGGEEFIVLAPGTDMTGARSLAERIRTTVADLDLTIDDIDLPIHVTVSIGIALVGDDPDRAIHAADHALYQAKRNGRNRVATSTT